ncbi:MAG: hypothetical protein AB7V42_17265 [Thermoleophilia bacterium]
MIVRILGEGQYRLDEAAFAAVDPIDDRVQAAAEAGDADGFAAALVELVDAIIATGEKLPDDELEPSDAIVPGHGTSLDDARELLGSEGLIPN